MSKNRMSWLNPKSLIQQYQNRKIQKFLSKQLGLKVDSYLIYGSDGEKWNWRLHGYYSPNMLDYIKKVIETKLKEN